MKSRELRELEKEMSMNVSLPFYTSTNLVFGEGNPDTEILFIGEAPGANEDTERRPFVGRSGQLLRKMICELGWKESDVYITNIVKRRPPENRDPTTEEIAAYEPYLARQIAIINAPIIVTLGRFAMNYFLPHAKISRDQGGLFFENNRAIVPIFHPAAALRARKIMLEFNKSLRKLPELIRVAQRARVQSAKSRSTTQNSPSIISRGDVNGAV